jgi:hypothetical protein
MTAKGFCWTVWTTKHTDGLCVCVWGGGGGKGLQIKFDVGWSAGESNQDALFLSKQYTWVKSEHWERHDWPPGKPFISEVEECETTATGRSCAPG